MTADNRVFRSLEKLKSQEKKPVQKPQSFFKDISEMDFDEEKTEKSTEEEISQKDSTNIRKIEILMKRMDDIVDKMSAGSNYLMYYGQIKDLENQFLDMVDGIDADKDELPPQLFNRIIFKKNNKPAHVCDFCDSLWLEGEDIGSVSSHTLSSFSQSEDLGYTIDEVYEKDQDHQPIRNISKI